MRDGKVINGLKIDPVIFTLEFTCRCIGGECCHYGVFTDFEEFDKISSISDEIIELMDESQSTNMDDWFESPTRDENFKSGICVGTQVINSKCTFLDKNGLCTLQKLAMNKGLHKWTYKPLFCVLFPLIIHNGELTVDQKHMSKLKSCNRNSSSDNTIFDSCKEELKHLLGESGFAELEDYREAYLCASN